MQTIIRNRLPVKIVVINNHCHGMVRQFQQCTANRTIYSCNEPLGAIPSAELKDRLADARIRGLRTIHSYVLSMAIGVASGSISVSGRPAGVWPAKVALGKMGDLRGLVAIHCA